MQFFILIRPLIVCIFVSDALAAPGGPRLGHDLRSMQERHPAPASNVVSLKKRESQNCGQLGAPSCDEE
ncbi:hypothetical protein SISSUDRAFT_1046398 [Sistotremastrum suecicum HHB10207 ss-3]|uniref:Uncharacterized protein n=1 Tax=Sistotremastrum suecicum HHB10207 ss-3 TaxID=1314776 RepID=A0A166DUR1_9AGAM|nr:hypothetical protein SISSUDRAFT_1046398 [Sistotremastrum suecicum HHB10207 ss-3]